MKQSVETCLGPAFYGCLFANLRGFLKRVLQMGGVSGHILYYYCFQKLLFILYLCDQTSEN
jgi:hypothetical protein